MRDDFNNANESLSNFTLSEIINVNEIQRLQDLFSYASGVASIITHSNGKPITHPTNFCKLCDNYCKLAKGPAKCIQSNEMPGRYSPEGPVIQSCLSFDPEYSGLWNAGASITLGKRHIANWFIGPVRMEDQEEQGMLQYADDIEANRVEFINALNEVPVMSLQQFTRISKMLFAFANELSEKAYSILQLNNQVADRDHSIKLLKENNQKYRGIFENTQEVNDPSDLAALINDFDSNPVSVVGAIRDKTDPKLNIDVLSENETKYRFMFANNPQPMWIYDLETLAFLEVNQATINLYGYTLEEFLSMTLKDIRPVEDHKALIKNLEHKQGTYSLSGEWQHLKKNGEIIFVEITSHAITFNNRRARHVMINDITDFMRFEKALIKSEEKYRKLHESMIDGFAYMDIQGFIKDHNESFEKLLGYNAEELSQLSYRDITPKKWHEFEQQIITEQVLVRGFSDIYEKEYRRKDGSLFPVEIHAFLIKNDADENEGIWAIVRDITTRKAAEKELMESRQQLLDIIDFLPDATFVIDNEKKVIAWNKAIEEMTGVRKQEMIGKGDHQYAIPFYGKKQNLLIDLIDVDDLELDANYRHVIKKVNFIQAEVFAPALLDGKGAYVSILVAPLFNSKGERIGSIESIRDITGQKQAEESLLKLKKAIETSGEAIFLTDREGIFTFINPAFTTLYGYTADEVVGKSTPRIFKSGTLDQSVYDHFRLTLFNGTEVRGELINKRKDGAMIDIESSATPIFDEQKNIIGFLGIQRDISDRKRAEAELQESERYLKDTQEIAMIGSYNFDMISGKWTSSEIMNKIFGITSNYNKSYEGWVSLVHPDSQEMISDYFIQKVIGQKAKFDIEYRILRKNDNQERWVHGLGRLNFDDNNQPTSMIGTIRDITESKLAEFELTKAKEKAEESDRLKSAFLANMSHEVRTPLNSILGFSKLLTDPDFNPEQKNEFINNILTNGNHLLTIISDIMDISKLESGEITIRKSQINAQKFISHIKNQFTFDAEAKGLELKLTLPDTEVETVIFADIDRLGQIFNNLISNAIKFTPNGQIEIGYYPCDKMLKFYVRDTGIGIPTQYHSRIFDSFRQVEDASTRTYGGNGLGLAISQNLVELMGGTLWVESEPGKGSTFYFTIPCH